MARSISLVDPALQWDNDRAATEIAAAQDNEKAIQDSQDDYVDSEKARLSSRAKEIRATVTLLHKELNGIEEEMELLDELWLEKERELRKPR